MISDLIRYLVLHSTLFSNFSRYLSWIVTYLFRMKISPHILVVGFQTVAEICLNLPLILFMSGFLWVNFLLLVRNLDDFGCANSSKVYIFCFLLSSTSDWRLGKCKVISYIRSLFLRWLFWPFGHFKSFRYSFVYKSFQYQFLIRDVNCI